MSFKTWLKRRRTIWHERFIPSLIAGLAVAILTFFFSMTTSNLVLFSCLGASAAILTHYKVNKINILSTVILSYFLALIVSSLTSALSVLFSFSLNIEVMIAVTLTTMGLYLFDIFHPPSVASSIAFLTFEGHFYDKLLVFISVIILLVIIKFLTYAFYYERLEMKKFHHEFLMFSKKGRKSLKKEMNIISKIFKDMVGKR